MSIVFGLAHFEAAGLINVSSVLLFILICAVSLYSTRIYFFLLPFIFIAFPAAVNDFFPSVFLGLEGEIGASVFPLLTHIDLFLLLGVLKKCSKKRMFLRTNLLVITVSCLFLLSFVVNVVETTDYNEILLLVAGLFPLRYLLLLILLLSNYDVRQYEKPIILSLILSIFFLLTESLINTYATHSEKLASGTLGSNTLANVTVSILIFLIFIKRRKFPLNTLLLLISSTACIFIILLTGTRISILAGAIAFILLQAYLFNWYKTAIILICVGIIAIGVYNFIDVPDRYSFTYLTSKIHINADAEEPANIVFIEASKETNSFRTRLRLYSTALYMLFANPVFGTGYGTFNYLKMEYGFKEPVLIDAHNGYLNTLAQLGLSSVFLLYYIYFYPILNLKKNQNFSFLSYLAIINLTMALCDISNAGIYKSSVFALLAFNAVVISMLKGRDVETEAHPP